MIFWTSKYSRWHRCLSYSFHLVHSLSLTSLGLKNLFSFVQFSTIWSVSLYCLESYCWHGLHVHPLMWFLSFPCVSVIYSQYDLFIPNAIFLFVLSFLPSLWNRVHVRWRQFSCHLGVMSWLLTTQYRLLPQVFLCPPWDSLLYHRCNH